jgi:nitroimidazol reductase NimA-like FMN-containing flavoprotein (pyridoxamine 5'-phosphate oxidase superfamily)
MTDSTQSARTTVKRLANRGVYDRTSIYAILDEALMAHVGFVIPGDGEGVGQPMVIPTIHARIGDRIYFHGSVASRMLRTLRSGVEACVTLTLLDGLVLARSAFHHSMNYRSVVILGKAELVTEREEILRVLEAFVEHVIPGRTPFVRPPNESELRQTMILSLPIDEASAKVRTGAPGDEDEDYALPIWAGVVPLQLVAGEPISDARNLPDVATPDHAIRYRRPGR